MNKLIVKRPRAGPAPSATPMAVSAGGLISIRKVGNATRSRSNMEKDLEVGGRFTRIPLIE
jgi:hypothetical protein